MNCELPTLPVQSFLLGPRFQGERVLGELFPADDDTDFLVLRIIGDGLLCNPQSLLQYELWNNYRMRISHIEIGEGITEIETDLFASFTALESISFPRSLTAIYSGAFRGCIQLKSIHFPERLSYLGPAAFEGCVSLQAVTFNDILNDIQSYAFAKCSSLRVVVLPSGLASLGEKAFYHCSLLRVVDFPDGFHTIPTGAFQNCWSLRHIIMGKDIHEIQDLAFAGCHCLVSLDLRPIRQLLFLCDTAFSGCRELSFVYITEGQQDFMKQHFPQNKLAVLPTN